MTDALHLQFIEMIPHCYRVENKKKKQCVKDLYLIKILISLFKVETAQTNHNLTAGSP